jgi:tetratricopeptide (TPR) repeat protein
VVSNEALLIQQAVAARRAGQTAEAERICLGIVAKYPKSFDAWHALGLFAFEAESFDVAASRLRNAVELNPSDWRVLMLLGRSLREIGAANQGVEFAERALRERPQDRDVQLCAGLCFLDVKRFIDAEKCFDTLCKSFPQETGFGLLHAKALSALGRDLAALRVVERCVASNQSEENLMQLIELQMRLNRFEHARAACEELLSLHPDSNAGHVYLAVLATYIGRFDQAESHWEAMIDSGPSAVNTLIQKGNAYRRIGMFTEANAAYQKALDAGPLHAEVVYSILSGKKVTEGDDRLVALAQSALDSSPEPGPIERKHLHYALGKAFDDLGWYERAIGHFDQANRLVRQISFDDRPFDPRKLGDPIQKNSRAFTQGFIAEQAARGSDSELPIFVVGMMRSGTTLVEQILSAHPEIEGAGEQLFWATLAGRFVDYAVPELRWARLKPALAEYQEMLQYIAPDARRVVDKNPANLVNLGLLHVAFPKAKIIYVRRTDIDVAMSIWTTPMETDAPFFGDRDAIVCTLRQTEQVYRHWRSVLPQECLMEVCYEDLVGDPEGTTRNLVEFCGMGWDDTCLRPEKNVRIVHTPSFWQVRQQVNKGSVGRYKRYEPWLGSFAQLL